VYSVEGCAYQIRSTHPEFALQLGRNGREHVKENSLMTANVRRWLLLFRILSGADAGSMDSRCREKSANGDRVGRSLSLARKVSLAESRERQGSPRLEHLPVDCQGNIYHPVH